VPVFGHDLPLGPAAWRPAT